MSWLLRMWSGWRRTATGLLAALVTVSLPVEITIRLVDHPIIAPRPVVTILTVGSCLLLLWSGLGLRRLQATRTLGPGPTLGT